MKLLDFFNSTFLSQTKDEAMKLFLDNNSYRNVEPNSQITLRWIEAFFKTLDTKGYTVCLSKDGKNYSYVSDSASIVLVPPPKSE